MIFMKRKLIRKIGDGGGNNAAFTGKARSLNILDKFEKQENVGKERGLQVEKAESVEAINSAFARFLRMSIPGEPSKAYHDFLKELSPVPYTAKDVEAFSLRLINFQDEPEFREKGGMLLSAIINGCKENDITIITSNLSVQINNIGFRNAKNITIMGDTGRRTGLEMRSGRIIVNGDAGIFTGEDMRGGEIRINGNAGLEGIRMNTRICACGHRMKGGAIIVEGNAGNDVGEWMQGGEIIIAGNAGYGAGYLMRRGEITINGNAGGDTGKSMGWRVGVNQIPLNACLMGWLLIKAKITVNGNTGDRTGEGMNGGTIMVNGDAGRWTGRYMKSGTIRVKGKMESWKPNWRLRWSNLYSTIFYGNWQEEVLVRGKWQDSEGWRFTAMGRIFEGNRQVYGWTKPLHNGWQKVKEYFKGETGDK